MHSVDTLLFFGSFDPITIGHEALIQAGIMVVRPRFVHLIPAAREGWGKHLQPFADRMTMINLMIKHHAGWDGAVIADAVEQTAELSGVTAQTLHYLKTHGYEQRSLGLLMGSDWIFSLPTWQEWEWMLSVAPAYVALRGRETRASLQEKVDPRLRILFGTRVFLLPEQETVPTKHVSSTLVRTKLTAGNASDLVIPEVATYIEAQRLYQT